MKGLLRGVTIGPEMAHRAAEENGARPLPASQEGATLCGDRTVM
ncbi:hypothetical protein [Phreatobacter sp.]|nr:hypothetical protein [Phreatobacter sp.]